MTASLGIDLAVVPNLVAHDAAEVDLVRRARVVTRPRPLEPREVYDLAVLGERENLAQALILRLLTPRGSLKSLGHAQYGSRLHELIGRRKTEALRNLCRAFVLEVIAQEPRVLDTAAALVFDPPAETPTTFRFTLSVKPRNGDLVAISLEVPL